MREGKMEDFVKLQVSLPLSLARYVKAMAEKYKISENEMIVRCLQEKRINDLLSENYKEMSPENEILADAFLAGEENEFPSWQNT